MLSQVAKTDDSFENMDVDGYWETVGGAEKSGERFIDICKDYLNLELIAFDHMWKYIFFINFKKIREEFGVKKAVIFLLVCCVARGIASICRGETFWEGFLYPWVLMLAGSAILLPLFLLSKKSPKAASVIATILICACILFLVGLFLLIVFLIIRAIVT